MSGYGVDVWCVDRLVTGRLVRGPMVVLQALYRRLITPRGMLRGGDEEAAYGLDLSSYVGAVGYETSVKALPGLVRGELLKDDRVADVAVAATVSTDTAGEISIYLDVSVALHDEDESFPLQVRVTDTSVALVGGIT